MMYVLLDRMLHVSHSACGKKLVIPGIKHITQRLERLKFLLRGDEKHY